MTEPPPEPTAESTPQSRAELVLAGETASPGIVIGRVALQRREVHAGRAHRTAADERAALAHAIGAAAAQLAALAERSGPMAAEILEFQIALLEDAELTRPAYDRIIRGETAAASWAAALDAQIADYEAADDAYFRARSADLGDLKDRVLGVLTGADGAAGLVVPTDAVLVGEDLTPSRFLETDWSRVRGAALAGGSASSHVAMLARSRGVPLLVGLGGALGQLVDGAPVILDAAGGRLIQHPAPPTDRDYRRRLAAHRACRAEEARYLARPAATAAGRPVTVLVNVDDPALLDGADPAHCDGIGLTRTEFLFHGGGDLPDEETQYAAYVRLLDWAAGRPVTIRTLDAGGDKPIPGLTLDGEQNPFLGLRGLRLSLARPDIFKVQLRALARAAARGPLKVMAPMVTAPRELAEARALFETAVAELRAAGTDAVMPPLGMMVEVPAAALAVHLFDAAFFSIGSNDLVQYVTAASRDNGHVAGLYDPLHPAVLELIARVVARGRAAGREVSLCGEMAADPSCLPALLDAGVPALSVPPAALGRVKAAIARHGAAGDGAAQGRDLP